jgi:hypothetical protein
MFRLIRPLRLSTVLTPTIMSERRTEEFLFLLIAITSSKVIQWRRTPRDNVLLEILLHVTTESVLR